MTVKVDLTIEEAEWLVTCLALVMHLSRHWDSLNPAVPDYGNGILAKLTLARIVASRGIDPDEFLDQARQGDPRDQPAGDDVQPANGDEHDGEQQHQ